MSIPLFYCRCVPIEEANVNPFDGIDRIGSTRYVGVYDKNGNLELVLDAQDQCGSEPRCGGCDGCRLMQMHDVIMTIDVVEGPSPDFPSKIDRNVGHLIALEARIRELEQTNEMLADMARLPPEPPRDRSVADDLVEALARHAGIRSGVIDWQIEDVKVQYERKRTKVMGVRGPLGFTEGPSEASIEATLRGFPR